MVQQIMDAVMANPDVAGVGLAVGFVAGYIMCKRKMRNSGMGMGGNF